MNELNEKLTAVKGKANELFTEVEALRERYSFDTENLKLHDVSSALYTGEAGADLTEEERNQAFEWFCMDEYEQFEAVLENSYVETEYIGRTSSFYFVPADLTAQEATEGFYDTRFGRELTTADIIASVENSYVGSDWWEYIEMAYNDDLTIEELTEQFEDEAEEELDDLLDVMDDISSELETLRDELENVEGMYEFIRSYKENQVAYFNEWLDGQVEMGNLSA